MCLCQCGLCQCVFVCVVRAFINCTGTPTAFGVDCSNRLCSNNRPRKPWESIIMYEVRRAPQKKMAHPGHPVHCVAIVVLSHVTSHHLETDGRGVHMRIQYDQGDSYGTIISKAQALIGLGPYCRWNNGACRWLQGFGKAKWY